MENVSVIDANLMIEEMPVDSFDWIRWRNFCLFEKIGTICRTYNLLQMRAVIRSYAVGYIAGDKVVCRPKKNTVAVMFLVDDEFQWCHLTKEEFEGIFYET